MSLFVFESGKEEQTKPETVLITTSSLFLPLLNQDLLYIDRVIPFQLTVRSKSDSSYLFLSRTLAIQPNPAAYNYLEVTAISYAHQFRSLGYNISVTAIRLFRFS